MTAMACNVIDFHCLEEKSARTSAEGQGINVANVDGGFRFVPKRRSRGGRWRGVMRLRRTEDGTPARRGRQGARGLGEGTSHRHYRGKLPDNRGGTLTEMPFSVIAR